MSAVLAILIGITAGEDALFPAQSMPVLEPSANGAPVERRNGVGRIADDETVGSLPPGSFSIERRIIIRIPMLPRAPVEQRAFVPKASMAIPSVPQKGAACLSLGTIRGASIHDKAGVLFVTTSNNRYQARLERGCRPVDFQSGFYLSQPADGAICAGRDMLHARSGLKCTIVALSRLAPGD